LAAPPPAVASVEALDGPKERCLAPRQQAWRVSPLEPELMVSLLVQPARRRPVGMKLPEHAPRVLPPAA
jgi:hypothetical protein